MLENPTDFMENPIGFGPGVYIGSRIQGKERLIRIVFQWLSRTKAAPALNKEHDLPVYQVLHILTMFTLLANGKAAVEAEKARLGIVGDVSHSNYTYSNKYRDYWVYFSPTKSWIPTGVTPSKLRRMTQALRGDPIFTQYVEDFRRQLDPELLKAMKAEARAARKAARAMEDEELRRQAHTFFG